GGVFLRARPAERDLDAVGRRTKAVVALVAGAPLVLADADLRAALVRDHLRGDGAVAEQYVRAERLALCGLEPVHEQRLALADAILLSTETDDCVVHKRRKARTGSPRAVASVATTGSSRPTPTPTPACSPSRRPPRARARARAAPAPTRPRPRPRPPPAPAPPR